MQASSILSRTIMIGLAISQFFSFQNIAPIALTNLLQAINC
jgi:hypothetical protein